MRVLSILLGLLLVIVAGVAIGMAARSLLNVDVNPPGQALTAAAPAREADVPPSATPDARRGETQVEIGEAELASELNARLAGQPLGSTPLGEARAESFTVGLRGGKIEVGGSARAGPASVPFSLLGQLAADATGRPVLRVTDARVSGVPVPDPARGQLEGALQSELQRQLARRPVRVRSVEIGAGRMRIIGAPAG